MNNKLLFPIILNAILFACTSSAFADTHYWVSTGSADWGTGSNWTPAAVPAANDSVVFSGSSTVNCTLSGSK